MKRKKNQTITYKNKYGTLIFEIDNYQKVHKLHSKNIDNNLFFDIETAEKIALITENKSIQLSTTYDPKKMFLIFHKTSNIAAPCKIVKLNFNNNINPQKEIKSLAHRNQIWY